MATFGLNLVNFGLDLARFGSTLAKFRPDRSRVDRTRPNFTQPRPTSANFGAVSTKFGPISADVAPKSASFGPMSASLTWGIRQAPVARGRAQRGGLVSDRLSVHRRVVRQDGRQRGAVKTGPLSTPPLAATHLVRFLASPFGADRPNMHSTEALSDIRDERLQDAPRAAGGGLHEVKGSRTEPAATTKCGQPQEQPRGGVRCRALGRRAG